MAAPATIPRLAPVGFRLDNGHSTTIAFGLDTNIEFWEVETEAPAINGGDPIDTTTMHNATWRTKAPRTLKDLEPFTVVVAYDPNIYNSILVLINETEEVTIHFPDTSSLDFFGYIQSFDPDPLVEGEQPRATVTIVPTNYDPFNCVEAAPVLTSEGTC